MLEGVHRAARVGYGRSADVYARARPSFPPDAVAWLAGALGAGPGDRGVVEVGAGTGKFTAALVELGLAVVAVEPVPEMRRELLALGPSVEVVDAVAEALPFESGSVPVVVASQSFHWFDAGRAFAEFDRVLAPGGSIGLIWNFRDTEVAWQHELDALLASLRGDAPHSRDGRWQQALERSAFAIAGSKQWHWSLGTDEQGVIERVRSVSYVAALPDTAQEDVDRQVRELLARHELGPGAIEFPYVTEAYVLVRPG